MKPVLALFAVAVVCGSSGCNEDESQRLKQSMSATPSTPAIVATPPRATIPGAGFVATSALPASRSDDFAMSYYVSGPEGSPSASTFTFSLDKHGWKSNGESLPPSSPPRSGDIGTDTDTNELDAIYKLLRDAKADTFNTVPRTGPPLSGNTRKVFSFRNNGKDYGFDLNGERFLDSDSRLRFDAMMAEVSKVTQNKQPRIHKK
jgi:hypothetical protein